MSEEGAAERGMEDIALETAPPGSSGPGLRSVKTGVALSR
jgi:hypothetical protein